jgi:hypothetical protein
MVTGSIPNQDNAALWTLPEQIFEKRNGVLRIARFIGLNQTLLGVEVNHAIVSLFAPLIDDGHFDPFVGFAPDIATQISPYQMALILKQDH